MNRFKRIVDKLWFCDWRFILRELDEGTGRYYLQVQFNAEDISTGKVETQSGRKWLLSPHMTEGEIVQTALMAVLAAVEHEARESFCYDGKRIFGPHKNPDDLAAARVQIRKPAIGETQLKKVAGGPMREEYVSDGWKDRKSP